VKADEQMMLFDAKSEFTSGWAKPKILAPWDARSLAWDIAKDVRNALEMQRFAEAMIADSSDLVWCNTSRQILVGLLLSLRGERGADWGWGDLRDLLALPQASLLAIMQRWYPLAGRSLEKASVTSQGVLINLAAYCAPIFHLADAWGAHPPSRRVSIVEWTMGRSPHRQLILQGQDNYGSFPRSVAEGIVGIFSALVASVEMPDDPKRKIWFVCDEVARLGKCPMLPLFSMGRSRGVRPVVAAQDLSQLEEIHGAPAIKSLVSMVGTLIVGQTMQGETADMLCKAFGAREVERPHYGGHGGGVAGAPGSSGSGVSYGREQIDLYKPSELASRLGFAKDGKSVALILFTGGDAYELAWPLFQMRSVRKASVRAAWTTDFVPATIPEPLPPAAEACAGSVTPDVPASPDSLDGPDALDASDTHGEEGMQRTLDPDGWLFTEPGSTPKSPR
jgi:Type IV secretion-system coupling protein DNA-binding domain